MNIVKDKLKLSKPISETKYNKYCELIYILAIDEKVAKIGGTYVGMKLKKKE